MENNQFTGGADKGALSVNNLRIGTLIIKTVALDGTSGNGATGTVALFTVTGEVYIKLYTVCTESLLSAGGGDIEVGTAVDTDGLIANTTATDIDIGEWWHDAAPDNNIELESVAPARIIANGADILATIATGAITDGALKFIAIWSPITKGSSVVAS